MCGLGMLVGPVANKCEAAEPAGISYKGLQMCSSEIHKVSADKFGFWTITYTGYLSPEKAASLIREHNGIANLPRILE